MFQVISKTLEQDKQIYLSKDIAVKGTTIYAIKLDNVNGQEYYFTFSYIHEHKAKEIAKNLWSDARQGAFYQDVNRTTNPQWTLLSELE